MKLVRRSRMRRTPAGKRIALTPRDIEVFKALFRYRYLRSTYLHAFVGGSSKTRFKERLGHLFHEGFLDRPARQWEFASARYMPAVYEIGDRAKGILAENACADPEARTFLSATAHRQFAHSVMICECLASIELAALAPPSLRFIPWCEILARAPADTRNSALPFRVPLAMGAVIPDGLFGIEYRSDERKSYRFFALEVDRGTMPIERTDQTKTAYLAKLAGYQEVMAGQLSKSHWGIPNLFVLTVTMSKDRLSGIVNRFDDRGGGPLFLFKSADTYSFTAPAPQLFLEPWTRAGLSPLRIDR
jgi:hypothetical protein